MIRRLQQAVDAVALVHTDLDRHGLQLAQLPHPLRQLRQIRPHRVLTRRQPDRDRGTAEIVLAAFQILRHAGLRTNSGAVTHAGMIREADLPRNRHVVADRDAA